MRGGESIIAVAPSIYDRFQGIRGNGFKFFGARDGKAAAARVIQNALNKAYSEDPRILKNVTLALHYTGFAPAIGIRCDWVDLNRFEQVRDSVPKDKLEQIHSALLRWRSRIRLGEGKYAGIIRFELSDHSFTELDTLSIAEIVRHQHLLRKLRVIPKIHYLLFRRDEMVPLLAACSGELCFITTVAFIASEIKPRTIIVIDEPETSLHPTWQKNYIKTLLDLFYYYEPKIVISTHSPILISGAEVASEHVQVHEVKGGETFRFHHDSLSLEEMYDRLFGIITPKSHYLSQRAVKILNSLSANRQSLGEALSEFENLEARSYDEAQQQVIKKLRHMAERVQLLKQRVHE
jgi:hypothetical protein